MLILSNALSARLSPHTVRFGDITLRKYLTLRVRFGWWNVRDVLPSESSIHPTGLLAKRMTLSVAINAVDGR